MLSMSRVILEEIWPASMIDGHGSGRRIGRLDHVDRVHQPYAPLACAKPNVQVSSRGGPRWPGWVSLNGLLNGAGGVAT